MTIAGLAILAGSVIAGIAAAINAGSEIPPWAKIGFGAGVLVLVVGSMLRPKPGDDVTNQQ
jgi:hypothetical protein